MAAAEQRPDAAIIGLGETGLACARHLANAGARVVVLDTRSHPPGLERLRREHPEIEIVTGGLDSVLLSAAAEIVISPGVDPRLPEIRAAVAAGARLGGELSLFRRASTAPLVAITGSNGKSTVTKLVGELLAAAGRRPAVGGNLGTPALELLRGPAPECYVLELSSFQLETAPALNARSAVVLNISADHLDRYPDVAGYAAAKARILRGAEYVAVNRDDPAVSAMAVGGTSLRFGLGAPEGQADFGLRRLADGDWLVRGDQPIMPATEVPLIGRHNLANVLAAFALVAPFEPDWSRLRPAVANFTGLAHRGVALGAYGGVYWVDDSKATNVGAAVAAVRGCTTPVVLIAGGRAKGQAFAPLAELAAEQLRGVVLMGADAGLLAAALPAGLPMVQVPDMPRAVLEARGLAEPGDTVLLAPACDSLDMYRDYAERGDAFRDAVAGLSDG